MHPDNVMRILIEFFRDSFSEDAAGVGDWFAQNGDDIEAFVAAINAMWPEDES